MNPQNAFTPSTTAGDSDTSAEKTGPLTDTKNKITQTARDAAAKVKSAATKAKGEAQRMVTEKVTEKKDTTAERIGSYSTAIHDSAKSLEAKDPNIAWFTHRAADRLQGVSDYLRKTDFNGLRGDCENIARRHPAVFFGGMFVAGLLVGNLVKATARRGSDQGENSDEDESPEGQTELAQSDLTAAERNAAGL